MWRKRCSWTRQGQRTETGMEDQTWRKRVQSEKSHMTVRWASSLISRPSRLIAIASTWPRLWPAKDYNYASNLPGPWPKRRVQSLGLRHVESPGLQRGGVIVEIRDQGCKRWVTVQVAPGTESVCTALTNGACSFLSTISTFKMIYGSAQSRSKDCPFQQLPSTVHVLVVALC